MECLQETDRSGVTIAAVLAELSRAESKLCKKQKKMGLPPLLSW